MVDSLGGLTEDEGVHAGDEVVGEADLKAGGRFELCHRFRGQLEGQGLQVVLELVESADAQDRVHGPGAGHRPGQRDLRCAGSELVGDAADGGRDDVLAFYGDCPVPPLAFSAIIKEMKGLLHNA